MGGSSVVTWRGRRFDPRTRDMLVELSKIVKPYINPTQGSYNTSVGASAGTHAGGGAVDIRVNGMGTSTINGIVKAMRRIGFAAWYRKPSQGPWVAHIHGIAIGCNDLSSSAKNQVTAYKNGRNGLANNAVDDGPKVGFITWEQYLENKDSGKGGDSMSWSDRVYDFVNSSGKKGAKGTVTTGWQQGRTHQYTWWLRNKLVKAIWGHRGLDYINDKPSTKNHQLARSHHYSNKLRLWLGSSKWRRDTLGKSIWRFENEYTGKTLDYLVRRIWQALYSKIKSPFTGNDVQPRTLWRQTAVAVQEVQEEQERQRSMLIALLTQDGLESAEFETKSVSAASKIESSDDPEDSDQVETSDIADENEEVEEEDTSNDVVESGLGEVKDKEAK